MDIYIIWIPGEGEKWAYEGSLGEKSHMIGYKRKAIPVTI